MVGVRTKDRGVIAAESVVIAGGRTLPAGRWLADIGARPPTERNEGCVFMWFTRYFRLLPHVDIVKIFAMNDWGCMKYDMLGADARTFCVELAIPTGDRELRRVREDAPFMAVARALPEAADLLDPERSAPIGSVAAIGQDRNVLRHILRGGRPVALGVHLIGDARCQTNTEQAYGAAMAVEQAAALADILAERRGDPAAQTLAFEARMGEEIVGRHALSVMLDRTRQELLERIAAALRGDATVRPAPSLASALSPA